MRGTPLSAAEGFAEYLEGLGANNGFFHTDEERWHARYTQSCSIIPDCRELRQVLTVFDIPDHGICIETGVACYLPKDVEITNIEAFRKIRGKKSLVILLEFSVIAGKLNGLKRQS